MRRSRVGCLDTTEQSLQGRPGRQLLLQGLATVEREPEAKISHSPALGTVKPRNSRDHYRRARAFDSRSTVRWPLA